MLQGSHYKTSANNDIHVRGNRIVHEARKLPNLQHGRWHYVPSYVRVTGIERDRKYATTKS